MMTREQAEKTAKQSWQLPLVGLLASGALNAAYPNNPFSGYIGLGVLGLILVCTVLSIRCLFSIKTHGRKNILGPAVTGLIVNVGLLTLLTLIALPSFFRARDYAREKAIQNHLRADVEAFNQTAPKMIDDWTRIDKGAYDGERTLTYSYTLPEVVVSDLNRDEFKRTMAVGIQRQYDSSAEFAFFREHNLTMIHVYHDRNGEQIAEITVGGPDQK